MFIVSIIVSLKINENKIINQAVLYGVTTLLEEYLPCERVASHKQCLS